MKRILLIFVSVLWLPFMTAEAEGCSCIEYNVPVCAAYWRADAVFAGQLLNITPVEKTSDRSMPTVMLHFIVEQPFRGVSGNRVEVETLHGTSCDMTFSKGERYLIYAARDQSSNQLFAGPCMGTTNLEHATDELNYIRNVTQQQANESILGRLLHERFQPIPGIRVTVQGGDKTLEARTDEKGEYSITVPAPGNYIVRAFIPFAAAVVSPGQKNSKTEATDSLTTYEFEVQVEKNQCQYSQIETFKIDLHATAEVSGNVLTNSGRAVSLGYVHLVNVADPDKRDLERLGKDGSFKFESVAAGEYYLVLNPHNEAPSEYDAPYPRTYYPGALEPGAAMKIVVIEGGKIENLTMRVGPPWKERVVSGKVVWQDGRPAQNARVYVSQGDRNVLRLNLDEKGRFNFKVYGDFNYEIRAEVWDRTRGKSKPLSIGEKSTGLKLVVQPVE